MALLLPRFATGAANQVVHIAVSTAFMGAGMLGVLIAPTAAPYLWALLFGIGTGACLAMGLTLFVLRASQVEDSARLSAMAQSIGYLICACGPLLFGLVHDLTNSWSIPLVMLLLFLVPQLIMGMLAGRARLLFGAPDLSNNPDVTQLVSRRLIHQIEYSLAADQGPSASHR